MSVLCYLFSLSFPVFEFNRTLSPVMFIGDRALLIRAHESPSPSPEDDTLVYWTDQHITEVPLPSSPSPEPLSQVEFEIWFEKKKK